MRIQRHQYRRRNASLQLLALLITVALVEASIAFAPTPFVVHQTSAQGQMNPKIIFPWRRQPSSTTTDDHRVQVQTMLLRGGANDAELESDDNQSIGKHIPSRDELIRRRGMAAALFSTYFAVMGAKCALPSVLSQLISDQGLHFSGWTTAPQALMARQLTLATVAVAMGKLVLGPVIDRFGGVRSLQFCLSGLFICVGKIAKASSFTNFAVCWIFVDFMFSSCWAACIHAIHQSFPSDEWAKRIAMLAAAARTGNASAFIIFSAVLEYCQGRYQQPWRIVFGCSALLQLVPIFLLWYFGSMTPDLGVVHGTKTRPTIATSIATLRRETNTPAFWLHFVSRSALMVFGSFVLFIPTLMIHAYGCTSSQAAKVGSYFALGCLLSVTMGSQKYSTLSQRNKVVAVGVLMGTATLCALAQVAHMTKLYTMTATMSAWSLFLWGFSFSIPFYIPPSLYSLNRGGIESSATIADVFDFGGFALLAAFNGYVAGINHASLDAWIPTFWMLTGCAATSALALPLALYFE